MAEKLNNFEKFERRKNQISALFSTQTPPDDWRDTIDHVTIGLVANKYTKLVKTSENLLLSQELSYIKIPLCYDEVFSRKIPNSFAHNLYLNASQLPFPFQQLGRPLLDGRP